MKKIIALLMVCGFALAVVSCGKKAEETSATNVDSAATTAVDSAAAVVDTTAAAVDTTAAAK